MNKSNKRKTPEFIYFEDSWNDTDYNDEWTDEVPTKKDRGNTIED